jgi:DME family drug/metabolite transporter
LLVVLLSFGAAALFALGVQFAKLGLDYTNFRIGSLITIATSALMFWLALPLYWPPPAWSWGGLALFVAIGCIRPFVSGQLATAGNHYLGPTISNTIASVAPLVGVAFGVLILGESLTSETLIGAGGIVLGVMVLSWRGGTLQSFPWWALLLPVGAAIIRALAQGFTKFGYAQLPSPLTAALVCYTTSAVLALILHWRLGQPMPRFRQQPGIGWFVIAGISNGLAIACLNIALAQGELVMVAPLVATSPVFTLLLSWLVFRMETISWRTVLGVTMVVPGVVLITLTGS